MCVADVALGQANVFAEAAIGGGHCVANVDDRHMCSIFSRIVFVGGFFAVSVGPVLGEHVVGLTLCVARCLLVPAAELLEGRLGLR
ncbi:hypothetical protein EU78_28395 [Mycolicibacterium rufum]|nr:hypothetical protein EU78_28395 [Mycolicibacterium rufum]